MVWQRRFLLSILAAISALTSSVGSAAAEVAPEKEFIMSCTYGVLAGTLVGAASLAFSNKPGESLQNVARGASIGLYVGIGLGYYTAYVLPKQLENEQEKILNKETDGQSRLRDRLHVFPIIASDSRGASGLGLNFNF